MTAAETTMMNMKRGELVRGWVLYDGECPLCINAAVRFSPLLHHHHFGLVPLQTPWVQDRLGLKLGEPLGEMKLLMEDGRVTAEGASGELWRRRATPSWTVARPSRP